jgi:hypothetical protein
MVNKYVKISGEPLQNTRYLYQGKKRHSLQTPSFSSIASLKIPGILELNLAVGG